MVKHMWVNKKSLKIWTVVNDADPNQTFEVEADRFENALYEALYHLGWFVSAGSSAEINDSDICPNCGSESVWKNSSDEIQCDNCGYCEDNNEEDKEE